MNSRKTLKEVLLTLTEQWLSSPDRGNYFKIQCNDFLNLVSDSKNEDDLLFNVINYSTEYLQESALKAVDSKKFIANVLYYVAVYYKHEWSEYNLKFVSVNSILKDEWPNVSIRELYEIIRPFSEKRLLEVQKNVDETKNNLNLCLLVLQAHQSSDDTFKRLPADIIALLLLNLKPTADGYNVYKAFTQESPHTFFGNTKASIEKLIHEAEKNMNKGCTIS